MYCQMTGIPVADNAAIADITEEAASKDVTVALSPERLLCNWRAPVTDTWTAANLDDLLQACPTC